MKHLHTFESYLGSLNEKKEFNAAEFAEVMSKMAQEMAKIDMALELMADDEEELQEAREATAAAVVTQFITLMLKEDYPPETLPKVKAFLTTLKNKFPEAAVKGGFEQATKDISIELSKVLEFEVIDSKADISEDTTVNQLAKAGEDDIMAGVKAITAHTDKFFKKIFA
jgi:hypothetical protein